jgi:hypothetical protein
MDGPDLDLLHILVYPITSSTRTVASLGLARHLQITFGVMEEQ